MVQIYIEKCFINQTEYDHAENTIIGCSNCTCDDGTMNCSRLECASLKCSPDKQITVQGECCPICPGDNLLDAIKKKHLKKPVFRWPNIIISPVNQ